MIITAILISVSYVHTVIWDKHAFNIVPLKVKQLLNLSTSSNLIEMADICNDRLMPACAEKAYIQALKKEPHNQEILAALGTLQDKMSKKNLALATYGLYFTNGGTDSDIAYHYAKVLDQFHRVDDAKKYYEYSLNAKPHIFQVTISKNYVTFLMKHNFLRQAKAFILKVRKQGENAPYFMDDELVEIKKRLVVASR